MIIQPYTRKKDREKKNVNPYVIFKEGIFNKLAYLTQEKTVEIAAFLTVTKEDTKYTIDDIYIPPQEKNTGAFVTTDDEKYPEWIQSLPRDVRQRLRAHFHTHPNMATTPSATDEDMIENKLDNIDDFYIRIIMNKSHEMHIDLYQIEENIVYKQMTGYILIGDSIFSVGKSGLKLLPNKEEKLLEELDSKIKKTTYYGVTAYDDDAYYNRLYGNYGLYKGTTKKTEEKKEEKKEDHPMYQTWVDQVLEETQYLEQEILDMTLEQIDNAITECDFYDAFTEKQQIELSEEITELLNLVGIKSVVTTKKLEYLTSRTVVVTKLRAALDGIEQVQAINEDITNATKTKKEAEL